MQGKSVKQHKESEENRMKADFTKNETMRKLASVSVVSADSEDGKKIENLIDGLNIPAEFRADAFYSLQLAFRLGQQSK